MKITLWVDVSWALAMDIIFAILESYIFASFSSCHPVVMSMTSLSSSSHSETESLSLVLDITSIPASFLPCLARLGWIVFMSMQEI